MQVKEHMSLDTTISDAKLPFPVAGSVGVYDGDDFIYLLGGTSSPRSFYSDIIRYTLSTEEVKKVGSLPTKLAYGTGFWDGTGVVYLGGKDDLGQLQSTIYKYSPGHKYAVELNTQLPVPNAYSTLVPLGNDGEALLFGGWNRRNRVVRYSDNATNELEDHLVQHLRASSSVRYDHYVYLFGGLDQSEHSLNSIVKYNIRTGASSVLRENLPVRVIFPQAVYNGKYAYVLGGEVMGGRDSGVGWSGAIQFSPKDKEITQLPFDPVLSSIRPGSTVFVKKFNRAYIFGGVDYPHKIYSDRIMFMDF
jgi:N-acetylneuraminic acid mutarotase